jgi:Zinc carboxypeptidase
MHLRRSISICLAPLLGLAGPAALLPGWGLSYACQAVPTPTSATAPEEPAPGAEPQTPAPPPIEIDGIQLEALLRDLVQRHPDRAVLSEYGRSTGGRPLWRLEVRGEEAAPDAPSILLVAALDGWRCFETRVALHLAESVLSAAPPEQPSDAANIEAAAVDSPLRSCRLVIVPRADPDGAEVRLAGLPREARPIPPGSWARDGDRDGQDVELGPQDLDGDGLIAWMRFVHRDGRLLVDEAEPRLLRAPKFESGESGRWRQEAESRDVDGDQRWGEDPAAQVQLGSQFPPGWPEHTAAAGPWPGYLTEARALMDLVLALEQEQLWGALVLDSYDTLVEPSEASADGRLPTPGFLAGDLPWAKEISRRFQELSDIKARPRGDSTGRFERWLYEQRGLYTLAWRSFDLQEADPKAEEAKAADAGVAADGAEAPGEVVVTAPEQAPAAEKATAAGAAPTPPPAPADATQATRPRRGRASNSAPTGATAGATPEFERERRQLAWIDSQPDEAWRFQTWKAFEHPDLGPVELGGWHPLARLDPPAADQTRWLEASVGLLEDLCRSAPRVEFGALTAKALGNGLYELEVELQDTGRAPFVSAAAQRARTQRPGWLTFELPTDSTLLVGEKVQRFERLEGPDQSSRHKLLISAAAGSTIRVRFSTHNAGSSSSEVTLP